MVKGLKFLKDELSIIHRGMSPTMILTDHCHGLKGAKRYMG